MKRNFIESVPGEQTSKSNVPSSVEDNGRIRLGSSAGLRTSLFPAQTANLLTLLSGRFPSHSTLAAANCADSHDVVGLLHGGDEL